VSIFITSQIVIFGTNTVFSRWVDAYGLPGETSTIPDIYMPFEAGSNMGIWGKTVSTLSVLTFHLLKTVFTHPYLESMAKEYLGMDDMPSLSEIEANTSLILMNSHFSEELPRSLPPLVIPVGGMHCQESDGAIPQVSAKLKKVINFKIWGQFQFMNGFFS